MALLSNSKPYRDTKTLTKGAVSQDTARFVTMGLRSDELSIPQSGGKMSKHLGGIIGSKYKTSWHLNGFPDGSNIGSTA